MQSPDATSDGAAFFADLRQLAAANPREARARFAELIDRGAPLLEAVLHLAAAPGEGRLRQMIANLARQRGDKGPLLQHLARWLETETDEFAAVAINSALAGVDASTFRPVNGPDLPGMVT